MKNCIFLSFDDLYFNYAKACINSIKSNFPNHPLILAHYLGNNQNILDFLNETERLSRINHCLVQSKNDDFNLEHLGLPYSYNRKYHRFILWEDYFNQYDTIVYIDCDTLVLKPFPELFKLNEFFVVSDNSTESVFRSDCDNRKLKSFTKEDSIDLDEIDNHLVNSGLLVIPKTYRTKEYRNQLWGLVHRYNEFTYFADQSIITLWMYLNQIPISKDYRYNFLIHFIGRPHILRVDIESIKIIHFALWKPNKNFIQLKKRLKYADILVEKAEKEFARFS